MKGEGIGKRREKEKGIGKEGPLFLFDGFSSSPLPRLFAPALEAIEFAQYNFTVHNKVVVAKHLGSVLQFHLKDTEKTADVYS